MLMHPSNTPPELPADDHLPALVDADLGDVVGGPLAGRRVRAGCRLRAPGRRGPIIYRVDPITGALVAAKAISTRRQEHPRRR